MFQVKVQHSEQLLIKAGLEEVRRFFADLRNFIEMMPNIESIKTDAKGVTKWKIRADIPLLGSLTESFAVELAENSAERIEWMPASIETQNFLRYAADLLEKSESETLVKITQAVELRRKKAVELHLLAPLAGEKIISQEMHKRVAQMIKKFLKKAQTILEQ